MISGKGRLAEVSAGHTNVCGKRIASMTDNQIISKSIVFSAYRRFYVPPRQ
jgi:hypothetical protein